MHWFLDPIQNHYFDFEGRTTRKAFWMYVLFYIIGYVIVAVISKAIGFQLYFLYALGLLLPSLGITARRLHDTGLSGWWQLIGIIPLLGAIVLIILTVREGESGANSYGAVPADPAAQTPDMSGSEQPAAPTDEKNEQADTGEAPADRPNV